MTKVSAALSCFEETIRENEASAGLCTSKTKSKTSSDRKSLRKSSSVRKSTSPDNTIQGESFTQRTEESGSCSSFDPAWQVSPEDDASSIQDGSFRMADDFDFEDDVWNGGDEDEQRAKSKTDKKSKKKSEHRSSGKKKSSSAKKENTNPEDEFDGFQVTYNGGAKDSAQERIRRSRMRKEESNRSCNSTGMSSVGYGDVDDSASFATRRSSASGGAGGNFGDDGAAWSLWAGGQQTTQALRRSSIEHKPVLHNTKKYGGSAGLKYGTPECEAYISSLPPAFQLSERRRLQQKSRAKLLKTATPETS